MEGSDQFQLLDM